MITRTLLIVPYNYTVPFDSTYPEAAYLPWVDGDTQTEYTRHAEDGNVRISFSKEIKFDWCLLNLSAIDDEVQVSVSSAAVSTWAQIAIDNIYAENPADWQEVGNYAQRINGAGADEYVLIDLVQFSYTSPKPNFRLDFYLDDGEVSPYDAGFYNVMFSPGYELPPPNYRNADEYSYPDLGYPGRSMSGNWFPNFKELSSIQRIIRRNYQWEDLTGTQLLIFKNFIKSFNNSFQPFVMVNITDDTDGGTGTISAEFIPMIIDSDSISVTRKRDGYYDCGFTAKIQKRVNHD